MSMVCDSCGGKIIDERSAFLCDYPVGTTYACKQNAAQTHSTLKISRMTCDKQLCAKCAIEVWPNMHLCSTHARIIQQRITNAIFDLPASVLEKLTL